MRRLLVGVLAASAVATPAAAAAPSALSCSGDLTAATPVLLIHGTTVTPQENWSWGYERDLLARGHGVCAVTLPNRGFDDIQDSVKYTASAIEQVASRSGRKLSIVGHSQGGLQPLLALRLWPQLAAQVDDVVGIAGVYDYGSENLGDCHEEGCSPAAWQMGHGSKLLTAVSRIPLPAGPSYSLIATLADDTVTPQPRANQMPGARSVQIQDVCPGRSFTMDHIFMAADAAMHALVIDALDHPGTVDPARVDRGVCSELIFAGADPIGLALILPGVLAAAAAEPKVREEPALRCPLAAGCNTTELTARVVSRRGRAVVLTLSRGLRGTPARVRLTARGRTLATGTLRGRTLRLTLRPGATLGQRVTLRGTKLRPQPLAIR